MNKIDQIIEFANHNNVPIIRSESGNILCDITKNKNPKSILEFGTAIGFSAILMLSCCDGVIDTIEIDKNRAQIAQQNINLMNFKSRANIILGDALEIAKKLELKNNKYDLIFLDCAKGQYVKLLPSIINLLSKDAILIADNVLFRGYVYSNDYPKRYKTIVKRLKEFIESCKNSSELKDVKILEIEDGILIATKV